VLVHGSGPNDRDSTVGSNKIFLDLAEGLASAGIAVLRYDKRTFRHGDRLTNAITIDEEVLDDALSALQVLAARPEVDARRVFVIGHSLGGQLAPEIAVRAQGLAGVVLLAPPGRPPWEILRAQMKYLRAPRADRAALERALTENAFGGSTDLIGLPYAYWRDLASRDGVAMARRFGRPVLVLHGDRDYQVTAEDLAIWKEGLAGARHVQFATFSGLNHLFIRGTGPPGPAEYKLPGHVDERVLERVIAFVRPR
jgi:dienelactone hydrolase